MRAWCTQTLRLPSVDARHPERSEGSPGGGFVPFSKRPHGVRNDRFSQFGAAVIQMLWGLVFCFLCINTVSADRRDPTKPVVDEMTTSQPQTQSYAFQLQSILVAPGRIRAMIDGQLVGVGSSIHGARVLAIGKNHVVLLEGGQRRTLYLFSRRLWKAR